MNDSKEEHIEVVYRILRNFKMTYVIGLYFRKGANKEVAIYQMQIGLDHSKTEGQPLAFVHMSQSIL